MNFTQALGELAKGSKVQRAHWKGHNAYVRQEGQTLKWGSKDHPEQDYHAIHADIFAEDWSVVEK